MTNLITGIHHVTALASTPQANLDFYAGILGLKLVKKTINFDAPEIYHLYYGDESGSPGTILTFFPYPGIPKGRKGKGQLTVTSFSIPASSIDYWIHRLNQYQIPFTPPQIRFGDEVVIYFEDFDGLGLELIANNQDTRPGFTYGNIPLEASIRGFHGVTLSEECSEKTAKFLENTLNHHLVKEKGNRFRYSSSGLPGSFVDILCSPDALAGTPGHGTIHHIAFATPSDNTQETLRKNLLKEKYNTTPVLDRQYFHSIYFREPGGVLFEIATIPPGFTVDEEVADLGHHLKLPSWQESNRRMIENELTPLTLDLGKFP